MNIETLRHKSYRDLTRDEWWYLQQKGIVNGCGGQNARFQHFLLRWCLEILDANVFVQASCYAHDFGYWKGGDEKRRQECDWKFYLAIINDIGHTQKNIINVIKYTALALIFYFFVHIYGKKYFNYH